MLTTNNSTQKPNIPKFNQMKIPLQKPLPFPHTVLDPLAFEELKHFSIEWAEKWLQIDDRQIDFSCIYIKHCCPENTATLDLIPIAIFMLWFSALNDTPDGPKRSAMLDDVYAALRGEETSKNPDTMTIVRATQEFIRAIHQRYTLPLSIRLRDRLCQLITATKNETAKAGRVPSLVEYLDMREYTIAVYPYLELIRLNLNVLTPPSHLARFERLEQLCVQGIYLVNDVLSVQRDLRKGKFNLVFRLTKDRQISIDKALEEALRMTHEKIQEFTALSQELLSTEQNDTARQYATFLGSIQEGNRVGIMELHERYFGNG